MSTIDDAREPGKLNSSQQRHLWSSCQYADKLLAEIEAVLTASQSKSPFPKFKADISPAQAKIVQDYVARVRAQIVRILASQDVEIPTPMIGSIHSIRVTLNFLDIAFEECRPKRMAGYGEVDPYVSTAIAGLVDEMQGIISRLDSYLAQGESADLEKRLERLEAVAGGHRLLKALERSINQQGLVEFRPPLANIIERLESKTFEIAVFGRVSSGKSSLLNHIVGEDILPVGVNPITAVPTRLEYGPEPRAIAWFADRKPERFAIDRLAEFVSEQHNPGNAHHVTRIVVELPAKRLREGIVYVDTPGLGSLATAGAAETKAYLPKCDLGVVLIDAGSTLTQEDLSTVQTLYDAGIPASVLLSKTDLLAASDCERARQYVAEHVRSDLGLDLSVHAVSIKTGYSQLLEKWFDEEILPLYDHHADLARQSINRKIGALRLGVEAALNARLKRCQGQMYLDPAKLRALETELRSAAGRISEARTLCTELTDRFRDAADDFLAKAALSIFEVVSSNQNGGAGTNLAKSKLEQVAAEWVAQIASGIGGAAAHAGRVLAEAGESLGLPNRPEANELMTVLQDMPRFDLGDLKIEVSPSVIASIFGRRWEIRSIESQLRSLAGQQIGDAVSIHARVLQAWVRKTFTSLQDRFDSYADPYRAQLDRLLSNKSGSAEAEQSVREDLLGLAAAAEADGGDHAPGAAA